jgi:hypothetical protein
MGWAGTHEFIDKSRFHCRLTQYTTIIMNCILMKRMKTEKLSTWFCLPIVIGFSRDESQSGVSTETLMDHATNYDSIFFLLCRNYEFMPSDGIRGRNLIERTFWASKTFIQLPFHCPTNMTNVTTNHVSHRFIMP